MLKAIKIKHSILEQYIDHFLGLGSTEHLIDVIADTHKNVHDKSFGPAQTVKAFRDYFEKEYDWHNGFIYEPKALFLLTLEWDAETFFYGAKSSIPNSVFTTPVEPRMSAVLPRWMQKGRTAIEQENLLESFKLAGSSDTYDVESFEVIQGELPHVFFQYLLSTIKNEESDLIAESVESYYRPEQLALLYTELRDSNTMSEVTKRIRRNRVIQYCPTNVTSVIVSTPDPNPRHREPNPSDRRDWRPARPVGEPTHVIRYVENTPYKEISLRKPEKKKVRHYSRPTPVYGKLRGAGMFENLPCD